MFGFLVLLGGMISLSAFAGGADGSGSEGERAAGEDGETSEGEVVSIDFGDGGCDLAVEDGTSGGPDANPFEDDGIPQDPLAGGIVIESTAGPDQVASGAGNDTVGPAPATSSTARGVMTSFTARRASSPHGAARGAIFSIFRKGARTIRSSKVGERAAPTR